MKTKRSSKVFVIGASIVIVLLGLGMIELLLLRFSAGDVYPPYSSLRADPLGTKALYESLQGCCDLNVQRNYEPFSRIQERFDATVLVLGFDSQLLRRVPKNVSVEINYFISNGGRLVVSFMPVAKEKESLASILEGLGEQSLNLLDEWGVRIFYEPERTGSAFRGADISRKDLPASISTHTAVYFQPVHPGWKILYQRNQHPVLIERKFSHGTLVLSAESYFLSNEALAKERQPSLLMYLVGDHRSIVFDEYNHGISADAGVMVLARRYHLEWLMGVFLLIAVLFIWKSAAPLVKPEKETVEVQQTGKESTAGLTNLLRRNIPVQQLLSVCFDQWQKTAKEIPLEKKTIMETMIGNQEAKPPRQKDLPAAYNALGRVLKERK